MEKWTTPYGKERISLNRDDEGPALPVSERLQSPLVITGPDGKIMTWDTPQKKFVPWSASSKFNKSRVKKQLLRGKECDASSDIQPNPRIPSQLMTPQSSGKHGLLPTPQYHLWTPARPPKTPLGPEYAASPITPPSKPRLPMSSTRRLPSRLRMLDDQELQASRVEQARRDLLMERQERAFTAWLNHVLLSLPTGGTQVPSFEGYVSPKCSVTSLCSNSNSFSSDLQLIDKDYVPSPSRDLTYPGRSLRSPLVPLNGLGNRGFRSLGVGNINSSKRALKDVFSSADSKSCVELSPADLHSSPKKLRTITEHGYSYSRDDHMQDVCRIADLARRLKLHFAQNEIGEILGVVTQLAKYIDEGRLRVKKGYAILADVALKKKALHVLLSYNACWMRIGLHAVLGHTALLGKRLHEDDSRQTTHKDVEDAEFALLKVFIKRHFFAHLGQATTNKKSEGLSRDEYSETLGRVILKRFFLLVLILDKVKCQTTLKITEGIDGLDGGSPLLFRSNARAKSSRQVLQEFLSGVMDGEGDLIENLSALGYHVHHHQVPLAEFDFAVVNLIEDLQDGVRLCRMVQLLAENDSRMLEHIQVPSNGRKMRLHNCQIALKGLARAGVPLEDEDGGSINAEDIVEGNKDKVFSLLWNIMVHLQIPVLVSRERLCQEIAKLQGTGGRVALGLGVGTVELLLKWTQVTCMISGNLSVRTFKSSFGDGYAFFLILKLYLPHLLSGNALLRPACPSHFEEQNTPDGKVTCTTPYKTVVAHNFGLVQDAARKLGSIPEVLQLEDLLGDPQISERNIVVFVAFLCSRLLKDNALVLNTQKPGRISQDADANHQVEELLRCGSQRKLESESLSAFNRFYSVPWPVHETLGGTMCAEVYNNMTQVNESSQRILSEDTIGKIRKIQAWWRARSIRRRYQSSAQKVQNEWHRVSAHLKRAHNSALGIQAHWQGYVVRRILRSWTAAATVIQRRYRALRIHRREQAVQVLQGCFRAWAQKRKYRATVSNMCKIQAFWWANEARGNFERERKAVHTIERGWLHYVGYRRLQASVQTLWQCSESAQLIQAHWRGYSTRRILIRQSLAASVIQSWVRGYFQRREFRHQKQRIQDQVQAWIQNENIRRKQHTHIARIQACWRGHIVRYQFKEMVRAAKTIQAAWRFLLALRKRQSIERTIQVERSTRIQACWRGHVVRYQFKEMVRAAKSIQTAWQVFQALQKRQSTERAIKVESSTTIQARWRGYVARRKLYLLKQATKKIQRGWRRRRERRFAATAVQDVSAIQVRWSSSTRVCKQGHEALQYLEMEQQAATKIQREWRHFTSLRKLHLLDSAIQSVTTVQTTGCVRIQAWWRKHVARRQFEIQKHAARKIQRKWRHWIAGTRNRYVSALAIQGRWTGHLDPEIYSTLKTSVLSRQSYQSGHFERKHMSFQRVQDGLAIVIRTRQGTHLQRRTRGAHVTSACIIEAWWRAQSCRRRFPIQRSFAKKFLRLTGICDDGATRIQATLLGMLERRRLQRKTRSEIQLEASEPESSTEVNCALEHKSVEFDSCLEGEEELDRANLNIYKNTVCSGDTIHSWYRGVRYTCCILNTSSPTLTIQTDVWRRYGMSLFDQFSPDSPSCAIDSSAFAPTICQTFHSGGCEQDCGSCPRQFLARTHFIPSHHERHNIELKEEEHDTERVDNLTRCLSASNVLDQGSLACPTLSPQKPNAAHMIISWLRTFAQRAKYLRLRSCAVVVQRHIRGRIHRSRFARMKAFAILVQAHWRGYLVRRGHSHPQNQLRELRQRIQTNAVVIQDSARLYNRLTEALSMLSSQETVSGILSTCRTIDVATQHSYNCCERLAEAGAVTKILLLIQTINRSPPHEQVLKHALSILSNLARHLPLATRVAQSPSAISIISEQLHTFRNDEGIFSQAMSVLQMVCKTSEGMEVLHRERSIVRRLLLVAQSLEGNVQAEKRTVETLPWATPATKQRKAAQTKMRDIICKFLSTTGLTNDINGLSHYRTTPSTTPLRRQHTARAPAQRRILFAPTCIDAKRVGCPESATIARQALSPLNGRSFSK